MELANAIYLIRSAIGENTSPSQWADFGCGSGLFTTAISELLPDESLVIAIDNDSSALAEVSVRKGIHLQKILADFVLDPFSIGDLDGAIMANSFHFVKDKTSFLGKLRSCLKPGGQLIIVEYDTQIANPWVPFPIDFNSSSKLLSELGFVEIRKLGQLPSRYQRGGIYALVGKMVINHELLS